MKYFKILHPVILTLIITLKATLLSAQSADAITGVWHVEEVNISPAASLEELKAANLLKKALQKTTFTFKANHHAIVTSTNPDISIPNGYWEYTASKKNVTITEWKDRLKKNRGILMSIIVASDGEKTFFQLEETPIKLTVRK
ncbi:MAG TPA: hypothetical protein VGD35_04240 [Chitinophaga sp.]